MASEKRLDIQALRALAVSIVILFHLWPLILPGGYVGVDVFFVISGFLITNHLVRELQASGTIKITYFYARRIRRLMPTSTLVLLVTLFATLIVAPWRIWSETATQGITSALGIQNWILAKNSVDYFKSNNSTSPFQHYWSLSVEEQFYIVWPLFILLIWFVALKNSQQKQILFALGLAIFGTSSLIYSIVQTDATPNAAYFDTFTHAWEFCIGGLVAYVIFVIPNIFLLSVWKRLVIHIVGYGVIVYSAFAFNSETKFPGYIALLPVTGALLILVSGSEIKNSKIMKPIFWIGDNSYAMYLWHWPLIVLLPFLLGHQLGNSSKFWILIVVIVLSGLTTRFVDKPFRIVSISKPKLYRTYIAGSFMIISVCIVSLIIISTQSALLEKATALGQQQIKESIQNEDACFGAAAMENTSICPNSHDVTSGFGADFASYDWGQLAGTRRDGTLLETANCQNFSVTAEPMWDCIMGEETQGAGEIAIVGDSHALALLEPLVLLANLNGYKVRAFLQNSCSPMQASTDKNESKNICNQWRDAVSKAIAEDPMISEVIVTGFSRLKNNSTTPYEEKVLVQRYASLYKKWKTLAKKFL